MTIVSGGLIDRYTQQNHPVQYSLGRGSGSILFRDATTNSVRKVPGMANRWWGAEHDGPGACKKSRREEWKGIIVDMVHRLADCAKRNPLTTVFLAADTVLLAIIAWATSR